LCCTAANPDSTTTGRSTNSFQQLSAGFELPAAAYCGEVLPACANPKKLARSQKGISGLRWIRQVGGSATSPHSQRQNADLSTTDMYDQGIKVPAYGLL